jgi:hypothetical protein
MWSRCGRCFPRGVAEAASAQGRVDVFVKPEWFRRMFPGPAVSASAADKEFVAGAVHRHSGRYLDEAFHKIESQSLRDVRFIAVTEKGEVVARRGTASGSGIARVQHAVKSPCGGSRDR